MTNRIVAYFSASNVTKNVAEKIAKTIDADIFEIEPKEKYSSADLNWNDKNSRSSIEMNDRSSRPEIVSALDATDYDEILIGFPVWWYTAPTIINTFIEASNLDGKTVIPFCTSGGSGIGACEDDLKKAYPEINWKKGLKLTSSTSDDKIRSWIE